MIQKTGAVRHLKGEITMPPDKSISHRAAMFAALSDETSTIQNYSEAADPQSTLSCLKKLGVSVKKDANLVEIAGAGRDGFKTPTVPLDCGNSGTTMRLLAGIVSGAGVECQMTGDASLSSRTMKRIITPLRQMGCVIDGRDGEFAPLLIGKHSGLKAMRYPLPIASAQLKSAVLLAGLFGEEPTEVVESVASRDHTERLLGLPTEPYGTGKVIRSSRNQPIPAQNYIVPGDFSAAAFWLVGGAIHADSEITLMNTGINPTRTAALHILKEMGADIEENNLRPAGMEPVADLVVRSSRLKPVQLDPALVPNCIDELPILMVAMCFADGTSVITGAEELRHKETDRLSAMAEILSSSGATIEVNRDGMVIHGNPAFIPEGAAHKTYHDHRMAMSAAILSSKAKGDSEIEDAECTAISYPDFWTHFQKLA